MHPICVSAEGWAARTDSRWETFSGLGVSSAVAGTEISSFAAFFSGGSIGHPAVIIIKQHTVIIDNISGNLRIMRYLPV